MSTEYQLIIYNIEVEIYFQKESQAVTNSTKRLPGIRFT